MLSPMGRKKKERPSVDHLFSTAMSMLVPSNILENFEMWGARENNECWVIDMREHESRVPVELSGYDDVVFDGFCNPSEMLSHSFVCKPIYLRLYRRRYKRAGTDRHYSNDYDFTLKGVKMVPELGFFLKE